MIPTTSEGAGAGEGRDGPPADEEATDTESDVVVTDDKLRSVADALSFRAREDAAAKPKHHGGAV